MPIAINGSAGTITGYTPTAVNGQLALSNMPSGSVLKTFNQTLTVGETISIANNVTSGNSISFTDSSFDLTCNLTRSDSNLLILADMKYSATINAVYRIYDVTNSQIVLGSVDPTHVNQQALSSGPIGGSGPNGGNNYATPSIPCMVYYNPPANNSTIRFKIQFTGANNNGTVYLSRAVSDTNYLYDSNGPSSLTILEIAA